MNTILAIETSCDETAAAIIMGGTEVLGSVVYSQIPDHHRYGGVVPEIASRKHIETIIHVLALTFEQSSLTIKDIEAVAVTIGPGLIGSLLVGLSVAKSIAYAMDIPIIPVDHLEGHIYSSILTSAYIEFPLVSLVVSGGHTDLYLVRGHGDYELLGQTRDDAAGEAFDKVAKLLGLGYPGGPIIDRLAGSGDCRMLSFPRAYLERGSLDFSFSGLKTAVYNYIKFEMDKAAGADQRESVPPLTASITQAWIAGVSASFQEAVVDVLVAKAVDAISQTGTKTLAVGGGVASNSRLRERLKSTCSEKGIALILPPPKLCVDNACMIGAAGYFNQNRATKDWSINARDSRVFVK